MHKYDWLEKLYKKMESRRLITAIGTDKPVEELHNEEDGCDLILLYPTRAYEHAINPFLAGFLAFNNTNEMMKQMADDYAPMMKSRNFFAGLNGMDPFKNDNILFNKMKECGFIGIHNYPAMSLVDGRFGADMENLQAGFEKEVQLLEMAGKLGFVTCAMVRTKGQIIKMLRAGADILVFYPDFGDTGLTLNRESIVSEFERENAIEKYVKKLQESARCAREISEKAILLFCADGIYTVEEVRKIVQRTKMINGFLLLTNARQGIPKEQLGLEIRLLNQINYD